MPHIAELLITKNTEEKAQFARVTIGGETYANIVCTSITQKSGIEPSECILRDEINPTNQKGPTTLNAERKAYTFGTKVIVHYGNKIMFSGRLVKRQDSGQQDQVAWTAFDDRWLFRTIPIRGAFVRDLKTSDGILKWVGRFVARTNPEGSWNCIGAQTPHGLLPVFSPFAEIGGSYENPTKTFDGPVEDGVLTAWTPRRWLEYLWLVAHMDPSKELSGGETVVPENEILQWRSLVNSNINWKRETITGLRSVDYGDVSIDPLDRKMPDVTFQGQALMLAIVKTLDIFGTHGMTFEYEASGSNDTKSQVVFFAREKANQTSNASDPAQSQGSQDEEYDDKSVIPLQRSGTVSDINTAFDYQLSQDATNVIGSVLVEGDNIIMETELEWNGNEATSTFIPSWTTAEEAAFIAGIKGKVPSSPATGRRYAKYPSTIGDTDHANYTEIADGLGGRPLARGSTMDAVKLLRQFFPRVFRAFWIKTENLSTAVKEGVDNKLKGLTLLDAPRPPLPRQMQYALIPALRDTTPSHRARDYLPVRVQVKSSTGLLANIFHDVTNINGLRVLGNGEIFLDGLAEELDGSDDIDKIYEGRLTSGPSINAAVLEVKLKLIKINIAFPHDHRVVGYYEHPEGLWEFDSQLASDLVGPPMMYIDSPGSYHEVHQIGSKPGPVDKFFKDDPDWTGQERYLPPGTERAYADDHARRKIALASQLLQESLWRVVGIRPSYYVGKWIEKVKMVSPLSDEGDWLIEAPIESVTFDFLNNETIINGLTAHLART